MYKFLKMHSPLIWQRSVEGDEVAGVLVERVVLPSCHKLFQGRKHQARRYQGGGAGKGRVDT